MTSLPNRRLVGFSVAACFGYLAVVGVSGRLLGGAATIVLWPPAGVLLSIAVLASYLRVGAGFLAITVALLIGLASVGLGSGPALVIAIGTTAIYAAGATLLRRAGFDPALGERRDLSLFLAGATSIPAASSGLVAALRASGVSLGPMTSRDGSVSDWLIQPEILNRTFFESWIGDATGILVTAPPLLFAAIWLRDQMLESGYLSADGLGGSKAFPEDTESQVGAWVSSVLVLVLAGLVYTRLLPSNLNAATQTGTLALLLLLPILFTATRLRPFATSVFASILCLIAAATTAVGRGPFEGPIVLLGPLWAYTVSVFSSCLFLSLVLRGERRAYSMARINRQLLERIVDHVPANISVKNDRGRFVFMNQRLADFLAISGEQELQLHPEQVERLQPIGLEQTDEVAMESGRLRMYEEIRLEAADGEWHDFLQTRVPMLTDSRRHELLTIQLDITDRKLVERALKESEAKLRSLMDNLAGWILLMDRDGTIEWTNRGFQGVEPSGFVGTKTSNWITEDSFARGLAIREQVIDTGMAATYEVQLAHPLEGWLSVVLSPVIEDGSVVSLMMLITDITELKREAVEKRRLESQMEQLRHVESLGALAGSVAHDFNNLLVGMLGNADYLVHRSQPETKEGRAARRILQASERARELCDQLLDYAGHGSLRTDTMDLNQLVRETLPILEGRLSEAARLILELDPDLPAIEGERTQLRRVLMNLLVNASDALADEVGDITVTTGIEPEDPSTVFLTVADTGCGMGKETRERIFDPFFSTKVTGRGLGLAACQGIVRRHGGSIDVTSRQGSGTRFKVALPKGSPQQTTTEGDHEEVFIERPPGSQSTRTVLLIDDDEAVTRIAKRALEGAGFSVLTAHDGEQGVELFDQYRDGVAAVVLDLTMPGMTGDQVLVEVRALEPHIPILISSGFAAGPIARRVERQPRVAFLPKPYRPEELTEALLRLLSRFEASSVDG